jgi:hypothetical protein
MSAFPDKPDLLTRITDPHYNGMKKIDDAISYIDSIPDVENILIPILRCDFTEETERPVYRTLRIKGL